jgi:hypothetical protein
LAAGNKFFATLTKKFFSIRETILPCLMSLKTIRTQLIPGRHKRPCEKRLLWLETFSAGKLLEKADEKFSTFSGCISR